MKNYTMLEQSARQHTHVTILLKIQNHPNGQRLRSSRQQRRERRQTRPEKPPRRLRNRRRSSMLRRNTS
jgi:hypothetical protein